VCINALPGFMGFDVLREVITLGRNIVDIAFSPVDSLTLDELARANGVTALVDCGVAPGMSNLLVGYAASLLEKVKSVHILVGGLPKERHLPWEYKAVFSPIDVIEEYTRPARLKENGQIVVREPLSEPELIDFPGVGTLEAFNTDGLRTLLYTVDAPNMAEKTLRYPGHREKILLLKQAGFLEDKTIQVKGCPLSPIDVTAQILIKQWELQEGEHDLTIMRVDVEGEKNGYRFEVFDTYDSKTKIHSMARTTGFTATIMTRALLQGKIKKTGILPLEKLGHDYQLVSYVFDEFKKRGVIFRQKKLKHA
jgi:lysine 6-dehydrogenase